jgi:hypothetical protein
LRNKTISLARRGSTVLGIEDLHQALRQGWRVVSVRSETAPRSAPLDFAVRVTLAMTQHHSVNNEGGPSEAALSAS